jgi:hypothetical protein
MYVAASWWWPGVGSGGGEHVVQGCRDVISSARPAWSRLRFAVVCGNPQQGLHRLLVEAAQRATLSLQHRQQLPWIVWLANSDVKAVDARAAISRVFSALSRSGPRTGYASSNTSAAIRSPSSAKRFAMAESRTPEYLY